MILPMPTYVVDFMLVANLLLAFLLLVNAMYVSDPLKLSALPTMLLLATLFRLALNVTTTRLILSEGDAGKAVEAFGSVVIGDNVAVGLVVFLVITLIQFIVIAKGSERVAEVAARFTLDALPGKQMSIDADVRAGQIDFETARVRRQDLQTESRFYGALDGAMKFIKGDAIAGIIVVAINIAGGLAIGVLMHGLDIGAAAHKFTTLTIGDGLLSQIPALLNSLAAGLVVTRVVRGDGASLAKELISQIGQLRRVKAIVGVVSLFLAIVPGMPILPLISLAAVLIISAAMDRGTQSALPTQNTVKFAPKVPAVLALELTQAFGRAVIGAGALSSTLEQARQRAYDKHGLILKVPDISVASEGSPDYTIKLRGVVMAKGTASTDLGSADLAEDIKRIGEAFDLIIERHATELIDDILTRRTLDQFESESPELVSAVVPGIITLTQLTELLKGLVREGITIRNFDLILQAVAESGPKAGGDRVLLEEVRIALKRVISSQYSDSTGRIVGITIEPTLDLALARVERENVVLDPKVLSAVVDEISARHAAFTQDAAPNGTGAVVVVSRRARRLLKDCLDMRGVKIPVLAHEEVLEEVCFTSCGSVTLTESELGEQVFESLAA